MTHILPHTNADKTVCCTFTALGTETSQTRQTQPGHPLWVCASL